MSMTTEIQHKQSLLSEHLLLLQQLNYRDLFTNYQGKLRLLDTIAVSLATGSREDVYAAAFDKHQRFGLVLAKNNSLTEEDRTAAKELVSLIQNPETNDWSDLFPFLFKRCGANINHRIETLAASMTKTLFQDFNEALETYKPNADVRSEFPRGALLSYGDDIPTFSVVWNHCIQGLIRRCKVLDLNPDPSNISAIRSQFHDLCVSTLAVLHSQFLKWLVDDKSPLGQERRMRVDKFKQRLAKCCQYVVGIQHLIIKAKRLPPIDHEWVTMDFAGSGQGKFCVASSSARDSIEKIVGQPLDKPAEESIAKVFKSNSQAWAKKPTGIARVHAELCIILHFDPPSQHSSAHAISVSKRSCLACALWIQSHNDIFGTQWMTSGSNGKPYPNWALPGGACAYQSGDKVDKEVMKQIYQRLMDQVKSLIPGKRKVLDEESADEEDEEEIMNEIFEGRTAVIGYPK